MSREDSYRVDTLWYRRKLTRLDAIRRLLASLFDTLVLIVVFVFFAFRGDIGYTSFIMALSNELPVIVEWTLWFTAIFFVINGIPLYTRGQTVGKWMLGLQIVDSSESGGRPALEKLILYRYVVFILLGEFGELALCPEYRRLGNSPGDRADHFRRHSMAVPGDPAVGATH